MENTYDDTTNDEYRTACYQRGCQCPNELPDDWVTTWWYLTTRSWGYDAIRIIKEALKLNILGFFEENEVHDLEAFAEKFAKIKTMNQIPSKTP